MNSIKQVLARPSIVAILFLLLSVSIVTVLSIDNMRTQKHELYYDVYRSALNKVSKINYELYTRINLNQALSSYIEQNPNLTQQVFDAFVTSLLKNDNGIISSASYEKDFVITLISPYDFNKKAIGLNLLDDKINSARAINIKKCVELKKAYVEGPLELAQDNLGIVSYVPIYSKDSVTQRVKLYGIADVVILWDRFLKATELDKTDGDIEVAIRADKGSAIDGQVFYGDSILFHENDAIKIPIELPMGQWTLAACPRSADTFLLFSPLIICSYAFSVLFSLLIYFVTSAGNKKLLENEYKFRFLAEKSTNIIWVIDTDTLKYSYVSEACTTNTGFSPEEYYSKTIDKILTPESFELLVKLLQENTAILKQQQLESIDISFEAQQYTKWGAANWVQIYATLSIRKTSKAYDKIEMMGITTIINDRKLLETTLKNNENIFLAINNNLSDLLWIFDCKTKKYSYVSPAFIAFSGSTPSEIIDECTMSDFFIPEDFERVSNMIEATIKKYKKGEISKPQLLFESQLVLQNKNTVLTETSATIIVDEYFEQVEIVGITRIIEERKKTELKLQESEKILTAISNNSNDHIWIMDPKTMTYTYSNASAYNVNGYTAEELMNMQLSDFFPPETIQFVSDFIQQKIVAYKQGEINRFYGTFETQLKHKNGKWVWIEISASGILDENSIPVEVYGISRNIEDRKRLELKIKEDEKKWLSVVSNSNDLIWILDYKTMKYLYASQSSVLINGYTAEEPASNITWLDSFLNEDIVRINNLIENTIEKYKQGEIPKIQIVFEAQQVCLSSKTLFTQESSQNTNETKLIKVWVEVSATVIINERFEPIELIGISRIIEDRKKMELAIKENERKYHYITEMSNDCIWTFNIVTMNFTYVSGSSYKLFGFTPQELYEMDLSLILTYDSIENITRILNGLVSNAKETTIASASMQINSNEIASNASQTVETIWEVQQYTKSGSIIWIESSVSGVLNEQQELDEIIGISRIIEDRKWLELTLKENEERYRLITESANDLIWVMNVDKLKFTYIGGACYKLFGYTAEEYLKMSLQDVMPMQYFDYIQGLLEHWYSAFLSSNGDNNPGIVFEIQQFHKDGTVKWVEVSARFIKNDRPELVEIVGVTRLIEARRLSEAQMMK